MEHWPTCLGTEYSTLVTSSQASLYNLNIRTNCQSRCHNHPSGWHSPVRLIVTDDPMIRCRCRLSHGADSEPVSRCTSPASGPGQWPGGRPPLH